jgi:4-hydroxybenzoate polyprenyltransferase
MLQSSIVIVRSTRPYLWIAISVNTVAAGLSLGNSVLLCLVVGAILSCLASFGFLLNDLVDRPIDRLNRQGRLEDASYKTRFAAAITGVSLAITSLVLALLIGKPIAVFLALFVLLGLVLYNLVLRRVPFVATALAAWLCASPLWFMMGLQLEHVSLVHILVLKMVVIGTFAREVMLDLKDIKGDRIFGRHTIPSLVGHRISCILSLELMLVTCGYGVASLSRCSGGLNGIVLVSVFLLMVFLLLIRPSLAILRSGTRDMFKRYVATTRLGLLLIPPFVLLGSVILG